MDKDKNEIDVKFLEVFSKGIAGNKGDDDIKMSLLKAGAKFSSVNSIFNNCMIEKGLRLNRIDKLAVVEKICNAHEIANEEGFDLSVDAIVEKAQVSMLSAAGSVRSWAKSNGADVFNKPRGGNGQGQTGFSNLYYKFLLANPTSEKSAIDAYIDSQPDRKDGTEVSKNVIKHASMYRSTAVLVGKVHANAIASLQA